MGARLTIATSDISGAGTDADISVIFCGTNGYYGSWSQSLDNPGNDFESGSIGVYDVNLCYITEVKAIYLTNHGGGSGPDWHVAWIRLEDSKSGLDVYKEVNQWINSCVGYHIHLEPTPDISSSIFAALPQEVLDRTPRPAVLRHEVKVIE